MDLTFGKEELAFQQEVRAWLKDNLTPEIMGEIKVGRNAYVSKERLVDWQKRLAKKGWLCTGWPKEFGGPGFSTQNEDASRAFAGKAKPESKPNTTEVDQLRAELAALQAKVDRLS